VTKQVARFDQYEGAIEHVDEDWWPDSMRYLLEEDPWLHERVVVAERRSFNDPYYPGARIMWSALVTPDDLATLDGALINFDYDVDSTGRPGPDAAGQLNPGFRITAVAGDRRIACEPLVLGWESNNRTAMVLDPRFAMTYGLVPRALADGSIHWDDPAAPEYDVAIVDPPSVYADLRETGARAIVSRDHLQDYLTLRGMHLVQVRYENRRSERDDAADAFLGERERVVAKLTDREVDVARRREGGFSIQIWAARLIAGPGTMPVTVDPLDHEGLRWPGVEEAVTHAVANRKRPWDRVFVRDDVLGDFEGRPGFTVHPESGAVTFGNQWGVGHSTRIGRDVIALELRKLYEGTPSRIIRHWNTHAVAPDQELAAAEGRDVPNVATRTKALVDLVVRLGEALAVLSAALGLPARAGAEFTRLDRAWLDYNGWSNDSHVEPVARHIPLSMPRDVFLVRCNALDKLVIEALAERHLRAIVRAIAPPHDDVDRLRGLKLLDRIVCQAQVAAAAGLRLGEAGAEVAARYRDDGTDPARPLSRVFALSDLRQVAGHRKEDVDAAVAAALARFGLDTAAAAAGWGTTLDAVYDGLAAELDRAVASLVAAITP